MRALRSLSLPLLPAMLAIAALAAPASALADAEHEHGSSGHDMAGMEAEHGSSGHDMGTMGAAEHGMSPGEHAAHGASSVAEERPIALLLGGFAALNALVLLAAALLRRRPAAIKRRETLARVRRAAGARTAEATAEAGP